MCVCGAHSTFALYTWIFAMPIFGMASDRVTKSIPTRKDPAQKCNHIRYADVDTHHTCVTSPNKKIVTIVYSRDGMERRTEPKHNTLLTFDGVSVVVHRLLGLGLGPTPAGTSRDFFVVQISRLRQHSQRVVGPGSATKGGK